MGPVCRRGAAGVAGGGVWVGMITTLFCKRMTDNAASNDLCEYVALVKWIRAVERSEARRLEENLDFLAPNPLCRPITNRCLGRFLGKKRLEMTFKSLGA